MTSFRSISFKIRLSARRQTVAWLFELSFAHDGSCKPEPQAAPGERDSKGAQPALIHCASGFLPS